MPIVRVAVLAAGDEQGGRGRLTDVALPAGLPLREIVPAVRRIIAPEAASGAELSLAPLGGAAYSLDATLDTVGVVDGDLLALQPVPAGPPAPRIVEDIADAAAIFSAARENPWGNAHIRRLAAWAVVALTVLATVLATLVRVRTGQPAGLFTVVGVAVLTVAVALLTRPAMPRLATALSLAALLPVGAAFALAVPGPSGPATLLLGAAAVAAWSIVSITVGGQAIAAFTATTVLGIAGVIVGGAASLWQLNNTVIGAVLIVFALLVMVQAAQLSTLWARFPVPNIPAPGDPTPSALPRSVLADLPRRVRVCDAHQTGFLAGAVLTLTAGSVVLVAGAHPSPWAWYVVVAAALATALRARIWDSVPCKVWLLSQPYLLAAVLLTLFAGGGHYANAWWSLGVLGALVTVGVVAALNPQVADPQTYSLPMRRLVGFAATALDASLIPVLAYLVGLFAWVINR
ncbi:type VII secretion integral membrane protein EccD [Mycolicibacterium mucogenicum]|uniref:Type VII secretion integral membrane protein EccD n=1 Tax=Mycolicibacterium mucogenicum TaxID=56689 RepID=A0A1A0M1M8_MYCMU|nr:type VII secretion integral membrane protein EccD [Mycolicibacterium mucogenicum]OBA79280.1 type VII secretion integral membrane protein EccD [Mycolicibacterium mucogenicum]